MVPCSGKGWIVQHQIDTIFVRDVVKIFGNYDQTVLKELTRERGKI
jgi:hypothetical protein